MSGEGREARPGPRGDMGMTVGHRSGRKGGREGCGEAEREGGREGSNKPARLSAGHAAEAARMNAGVATPGR